MIRTLKFLLLLYPALLVLGWWKGLRYAWEGAKEGWR